MNDNKLNLNQENNSQNVPQDPNNPQTNSKKKKSKKGRVITITGIILLILMLLLLLTKCNHNDIPLPEQVKNVFDLNSDENLTEKKELSKEEIEAELNKQVQDGMVNISMNLNPVFSSPNSEGNLMITNDESNKYPQVVEIYKDKDLIYRSGGIPVGGYLENAKLDKALETGKHNCTAYFISVDPETSEEVSRVGANITIIIQ